MMINNIQDKQKDFQNSGRWGSQSEEVSQVITDMSLCVCAMISFLFFLWCRCLNRLEAL